ncbi:hypothetical protein HDU67_009458 [Dinochytrium kinnereticum]|nr:hypothetical protein HDU67_009458 [Dinochytrium kinnereticum]
MAFASPSTGETTALLSNNASLGRTKSNYSTAKTILSALAVAGVLGAVIYYGKKLVTTPQLSELITESSLEGHLKAFEAIAKANSGSRSILLGYNDSASYVVKQLKEKTNYLVTIQPFVYAHFENTAPPKLSVAGVDRTLVPGKDFDSFPNSGSGSLKNARIQAINSGCSLEDFSNFQAGSVALIGSGTGCLYRNKIANAIKSKAGAVLFYTTAPYGGPPPGRCNPGAENTPVIGISHSVALEILGVVASSVGGVPVRVDLESSVHFRNVTTVNVIADTPAGDDSKIIVAGSHLDSVPVGPGINDDGSGSAATLEVALQLYKTGLSRKVKNKVRFAWWSAEELGLLGSIHYVDDLAKNNPKELKKIILNLNNDMIGSPNGARFIYNGREAVDPALRGPSGVIQSVFEEFFDLDKKPHEPTPFDGRSDYGEFLKYGIPAGGLFTGAEVIKTEEQYKKYGGTPGIPYDPCYHQSCDTLQNMKGLGMQLLGDMASAMGHIVQKFAFEQDIVSFLYKAEDAK